MTKTDWRIVKSATRKGKWDIETRKFTRIEKPDGGVSWRMDCNWAPHSVANSKRAAVVRAMLLKNLDEILTWEGGPIKIGPLTSIHPS